MKFCSVAKKLTLPILVILFIVIAPYYGHLSSEDLSSNHQAWASFGSYFGGTVGPLLSLVNLLAVAWIGTTVAKRQQDQLVRKQLTIDLLNEYHSNLMHKTRISLHELITKAEKDPSLLLSLSDFEKKDPINSENSFRIYHFFEKWAVLEKTKNIDNTLLLAALGGRVKWWKEKFFSKIIEKENDPDIRESLRMIESQIFSKV